MRGLSHSSSVSRGHQVPQIVIFLNQFGFAGSQQKYEYRTELKRGSADETPLPVDIVFRFDENQSEALVREIGKPNTLTFCLTEENFELTPDWFSEKYLSVLEEHGHHLGPMPPAEVLGYRLLHAFLDFLRHLASNIPRMVEGLLLSNQARRFQLGSYCLPCDGSVKTSELLHRWWLFTDQVHQAFRFSSNEFTTFFSIPALVRSLDEIRAGLLKMRAHLAAVILEERPAAKWKTNHHKESVLRYHDSICEWLDYNLNHRPLAEELTYLSSIYRELGDLLFESTSSPVVRLRSMGGEPEVRVGTEPWFSTRSITVRAAFLASADAFSTSEKQERRSAQKILNQQWRIFRDAEQFFLQKYEIREFMTLSRAAADVSKQRSRMRTRTLHASTMQFLFRHIPLPLLGFLVLVVVSWFALALALISPSTDVLSVGSIAKPVANALFTGQFVVVYGGLVVLAYLAVSRFRRIYSLFEQALPNIFGGILVGYLPLCLADEMSKMPLGMSWFEVLLISGSLILLACLYFVVEVSHQVWRREEMLRKAMTLGLIALAQSYGLGLIATSTFGSQHVMYAEEILHSHEAASIPGALVTLPHPIDYRAHLQEQGFMLPLRFGPVEFWLFPKLLVLWFGLALFIGIFVQSLSNRPRSFGHRP